jgi:hypothetical protein
MKSELFPHFPELFPLVPEKREIRGRSGAGFPQPSGPSWIFPGRRVIMPGNPEDEVFEIREVIKP